MKTDSDLKNDVLSELSWDALVPQARVGVTVNDGVVTLSGHLDTYAEKVAARRAAERVSGIKAIAVELDVIPPGIHQRSDTEIAAAVQHVLSWNTSVPPDRLNLVGARGESCQQRVDDRGLAGGGLCLHGSTLTAARENENGNTTEGFCKLGGGRGRARDHRTGGGPTDAQASHRRPGGG